ncbi:hypothetical protein [uncultured Methylophaga sp.]|uniref:hypothetical protein n=1 Tax=uncultured Methylophaga sp. TaxID=285271 RepID=UPI0026372BD5|nr:hypothetical protein [uncultured Methylophaga sp.]
MEKKQYKSYSVTARGGYVIPPDEKTLVKKWGETERGESKNPGQELAARKKRKNKTIRDDIRRAAGEMIQRGGRLNHAQMSDEIIKTGIQGKHGRKFVMDAVKEECDARGRSDLVSGRKK